MMRTILLISLIACVLGHSRFVCPPPQDGNTGIKTGPCGAQSGDFTSGASTTLQVGWNTIVLEESISHNGAPFRIALSREGVDTYEDGILLDHIPHNDESTPNYGNPATWTPIVISVYIPNVLCRNCKLGSVNPMTDKLPQYDLDECVYNPNCTTCTDPLGTCWSTYHSCARVTINGTTPRDQYTFSQPQSWPYRHLPSNPSIYTMNEAAQWDTDSTWMLMDVPAEYNQIIGPCAQTAIDVQGPRKIIN